MTKLSENHSRFKDAIWYDPTYAAPTIGGAGGIGSWLSFFLARAGYSLTIFDGDTVDTTNLGGQLYGRQAIGQLKSNATAMLCQLFGADQRVIPLSMFTESHTATSIVFSAFDNMKARTLLFNKWAELNERRLFVDGRMLAESGQIFFVQRGEEEKYRSNLFDDKEVKEQPCSMKATSHCGAFIASLMMSGFTNWIANQKFGEEIREVPFKTEFELPLMNFTFKKE